MPHSDSTTIPHVLKLISDVKPQTILDIGVGWGKYGALFRFCFESDYADVSDRNNWKIQIDGIEAWPEYIGQVQRSIYNNIYIGQVETLINDIDRYDVIFLGDVIEHLEKNSGKKLLDAILKKANKLVLVVTPNGHYEQDAILQNPFECHRSAWEVSDFQNYLYHEIYANRKIIMASLSLHPLPSGGKRWSLGPFRRSPFSERCKAFFLYKSKRLLGKKVK